VIIEIKTEKIENAQLHVKTLITKIQIVETVYMMNEKIVLAALLIYEISV
jgi:hypothetical protein